MADNRKVFRARRLAFGGRFFPRACIFGASLALYAACVPAQAQDTGLRNGTASLAAGKYDAAVRQLSATINSDSASPGDAAKALYLRGIAYRKMGEPARAAADLGAAIWLGLPEPDKVKALVNRGLAFQAAGLSKEGEAELAAARKAGGSRAVDDLIAEGGGAPAGAAAIAAFATEVRPEAEGGSSTTAAGGEAPASQSEPPTRTANASPGAWSTSVANESKPPNSSGGNRLTRWFGSVTGSSASEPAAPAPAPAPTPEPAAQPSKPAPQPSAATTSSSWSTTTDTPDAAASTGESKSRWARLFNRSANAEPEAQPAAASSAGGAYRLQLATSRSEEEANALWKKVSQNQGLAGIRPEIAKVEIGSFGTFYSLRIGPFPDKAESLKVCNALKRSGIDCSPATP
ncbi:MAG TPA: SPOR domain-containing protein [Hyphomicrobiaceae bacterium]|nr:SPOR domain-containing protein [Hyphomicrobiaceae bacterium]